MKDVVYKLINKFNVNTAEILIIFNCHLNN